MSEASKWKRRERALTLGVVLWAVIVAAILVFAAESAAEWLLATPPHLVAGGVLMSIGLCGGFAQTLLELADWWAESDDEDLTEVPWDE